MGQATKRSEARIWPVLSTPVGEWAVSLSLLVESFFAFLD